MATLANSAERRDSLPSSTNGPDRQARPWLMLNMIVSINGAYSVDGVSGGLGNPVDKSLLTELRSHADVLLVGRKTTEAEGYSRPTTDSRVKPRVAVVTSSPAGALDSVLFEPSHGEGDPLPIIVTGGSAGTLPDASSSSHPALAALISLSDPAPAVLNAGREPSAAGRESGGVDFGFALQELGRLGAEVVLCEGGPTLNAQLLDQNLVDEINLTISPVIAAGATAPQLPPAKDLRRFRLAQLAEGDGYLFLRYVRA